MGLTSTTAYSTATKWAITITSNSTNIVYEFTAFPWPTWPEQNRPSRQVERAVPTKREIALRLARERSKTAIEERRLEPPPALAERLYFRPKRRGRACGSRHRVMLG